RPAPRGASGAMGQWWRSPIPTPPPKSADRAGLSPGRSLRAASVVSGRGRALPGRAPAGCLVAARRRSGAAAARVCPRRDGEAAHLVSSGYGGGARGAGGSRPERRVAPVAPARADGDPDGLCPSAHRAGAGATLGRLVAPRHAAVVGRGAAAAAGAADLGQPPGAP